MKILIATPEAAPFAKTGGLADVTGALLREFRRMKKDAHLIMPLYRNIRENFRLRNTGLKIKVPVGRKNPSGRIFSYSSGDGSISAYFIECNEFFDRENLYGAPSGDYPDNAARFIFLSRGLLEACKALKFSPDVIHCNDWQTGLVPLYLRTLYKYDRFFRKTASVITVHNLGYQGLFHPSELPLTGLDWTFFNPEGIEFYGRINFLKAGLISADSITTVSDNYAREILGREYGFGLDGVLRKRASILTGIVNGIDYDEWNPAADSFIPANYSREDISNKKTCKLRLLKECGLDADAGIPVIGMVSRLSSQKGLDLFLESVGGIISSGACFVILGKGDEAFQTALSSMAERYRRRIYVKTGFEDVLAHKIYAGADMFLMPSRYEPCGLGQLIAMKYGTIPLARKTGGLADTIQDYEPLKGSGTGFLFSEYTPPALQCCVQRALCLFVNKEGWDNIITNAMNADFSWETSAKKYAELYSRLIKMKRQ